MFDRLRKAELKSNQDVFDKYVVNEYRQTVRQIIKVCKLKTLKKFMEEMFFTETKHKQLFNAYKELQMDGLEPFRLIVQKQEQAIEKQKKILSQMFEQYKPFIPEKQSELQIVDAEYQTVYEQ